MSRLILILAALSIVAWSSTAQSQTLTLLGTPNFEIDDSISLAPYTQNASSFSINGSFGLGDGVGGGFLSGGSPVSYDWSAYPGFGLTMSLTGANPNTPFTVYLIDSEFEFAGTYSGTTENVTAEFTLIELEETFRGSTMTDIIGMQITLDGSGSINTTISDISAVPEPSTWAMLVLGGLVAGAVMLRRRFAVARR